MEDQELNYSFLEGLVDSIRGRMKVKQVYVQRCKSCNFQVASDLTNVKEEDLQPMARRFVRSMVNHFSETGHESATFERWLDDKLVDSLTNLSGWHRTRGIIEEGGEDGD